MLGYYSTQKIDSAKIVLANNGEIIFEKTVEISPAVAFSESVKIGGAFKMTDLYTEMVNAETGEILVSQSGYSLYGVADLA